MPGMSSGLSANNPTVVAAFHRALERGGIISLLLIALVLLVWNALRATQLKALRAGETPTRVVSSPESPARRLLRLAFGCLWVFDGLLQAQPAMPLGLVPGVIHPTASSSPHWVQVIVNAGGTIWNYHPITAAAATVWIQIGIGLMLLVAPRGNWSRLAGAASASWGLLVWIFGESFGGIFSSGPSFLFGVPGAAFFYCAAGVLLALPEGYLSTERAGRVFLRLLGIYLLGMALLQAWPGRGFWQAGPGNATATMSRQMAGTPQPGVFSAALRSFASFASSNPFAVNLVIVAFLVAIGALFVTASPRLCRIALPTMVVLALAVWFFVQDLGFFGGLGTDPNSMVPLVLLSFVGYLTLTHPVTQIAPTPIALVGEEPGAESWLKRTARERPSFLLRGAAAVGAGAIVLLGAVPMAVASVSPTASPLVANAQNGSVNALDTPAAPFSLTDQLGRRVSLSRLRGRVVVVAFLDPVCTSDCPLEAQELRQVDRTLGSAEKKVAIVAIATNPLYHSVAAVRAFTNVEGMRSLPNWYFLAGSLTQLNRVWSSYGVQVAVERAGTMVAHSELLYLINRYGQVRYTFNASQGNGAQSFTASFDGLLRSRIEELLSSR